MCIRLGRRKEPDGRFGSIVGQFRAEGNIRQNPGRVWAGRKGGNLSERCLCPSTTSTFRNAVGTQGQRTFGKGGHRVWEGLVLKVSHVFITSAFEKYIDHMHVSTWYMHNCFPSQYLNRLHFTNLFALNECHKLQNA